MILKTNTPLSFFMLAILTLFTAACTVGPDYEQPAVVQPAAFKYQDGWQPLPSQPWENSGEWWQVFEDPKLTELVELAAQRNQTLAQAEAQYRAALAQRRSAKSGYYPTLNANLGTTRSGGSDVDTSDQSDASLGLSWELDLWGRVRRQVESDTAALQGSAADLAAAQLSIQLSVTLSYINLRALDQQQYIQTQAIEAFNRSAQLTRNQYSAGIVSRADVIQAETQLQSIRSNIYDLQNQRAIEENTIAILLGMAPSSFSIDTLEKGLPVVPAIPAQLPGVLIARRPDVIAAERRVAAANANIGVASAAWLPTFSISALGGVTAEHLDDLFDSPVRYWSLGPTLAQTIFDGGLRSATRDIAIALYDQQVAAYRQTVLTGLQEVENALATTRILAEKAVQQDKLVELAEQNEKVITNQYKLGQVSFLEVAVAQNTRLNAYRDRVSVNANRLSASATLAAAVGGGWDMEQSVRQTVSDHEKAQESQQ